MVGLLRFWMIRRGLDFFGGASQFSCVAFGFAGSVSLGGPLSSGGLILMGLSRPRCLTRRLAIPGPWRSAKRATPTLRPAAACRGTT
jgi:hypothetical protein